MRRFAMTVAALLATTAVNAEIYQWKDESGRTVISDKPPVGGARSTRKADADPAAPSPAAAPQKTTADRDLEFRKRQKEAQDKAEKSKKEEAAAAEGKENCDKARRNLNTLESGERISLTDEKGERYYMEDTQRQQDIAKTRQLIQSICK